MNVAVNNVVGLHTGTVGQDIKAFIGKSESTHTKQNYERSIRLFFKWYRNKDIEQLLVEDLSIRNVDMLRYQKFLRDHSADYTNTSINNMMAAVQSLYEFLERNEYEVNSKHVKVDVLSDDSEPCGALYFHEAEQMANLALKQKKGQEKSTFIRMAYTTSFRKSSLLALKWDDIKKNPVADHYLVTTIGKRGKKHTMPISNDLYNELLKIKEQKYYQQYIDNKIFHLSNTTIQSMMDTLKEEMQISNDRNVVFHSFRNVAASYGTLEEVKEHLNHSNINTTQRHYRHKNKDYANSISLRMEDKIENDIFEGLSKEELIELIMKQSVGTLIQMKKAAKGMIETKKEMID
ncbi:site-specific tyrosine recombinase XerC [compost metagenome]